MTVCKGACYSTAPRTALAQNSWKGLGTYGTLGLEIVLGILFPSYVGIQADRHFGTGRLWVAVGFFFGVAHGVRAVYRAVARANREAEEEEQRRKAERDKYYEKSD